MAAGVLDAHREVLPLWFTRVVPLDAASARRVERYREAVVQLSDEERRSRPAITSLVSAIDAWLPRGTLFR